MKRVLLFFRVIIKYWELDTPRNRERYKIPVTTHYKDPEQDSQFDDYTKDVLKELWQDDYLDADKELEANLYTD